MKIAKTVLTALVAATVSLSVNAQEFDFNAQAAAYAKAKQEEQATNPQATTQSTLEELELLLDEEEALHRQQLHLALSNVCRAVALEINGEVLQEQKGAYLAHFENLDFFLGGQRQFAQAALNAHAAAENSRNVSQVAISHVRGQAMSDYNANINSARAMRVFNQAQDRALPLSEEILQFRSNEMADLVRKLASNKAEIMTNDVKEIHDICVQNNVLSQLN